jgi:hypothetical protein
MKRNLQSAFLLTTGLIFLCQIFAQTQAPAPATGTLKGVVTDQEGAPLDGTLIRAEYWGVDARHHPVLKADKSSYTDSEGRFSFTLEPGTYDIFVSSLAFSPVAKKVEIEARKEIQYNPELSIDPLTELIP